MPRPDRSLLTGWGRTAPTAATVVHPADADELSALLGGAGGGPAMIARGLGRSYGDAAQVAGGTVIELDAMTAPVRMGPETGTVAVSGGTSLDTVLRRLVPKGWFVPVTPGTRHVTIGGAVAADVHGKNHHRDGAFCAHVGELELATPVGPRRVGPDVDPDLFWATAGGMGLTGVVVSARVSLRAVESAWMLVDTDRAADLDSLMALLEAADERSSYSVAWIDCGARGRRLGRGVVTRGEHAVPGDLAAGARRDPFAVRLGGRLTVPFDPPGGLLNPLTVRAFNEAWYRRAPRHEEGRPEPYPAFFHPLDGLGGWNRLYGRRGFVQYQFAVPSDQGEAVRRAVERLADARAASFLAVLKRFGPGDPGPLSFPIAGWTLALDLPAATPGLADLLDGLDELVVSSGGRVYLAKDSRLRPELLGAMYPRLDELAAVRARVDPDGVLRSDLARRLGLAGTAPPRHPGGRR
ncbi:MAG TPA: FAD-binding oxidoreductase [Acidimicrobiales bacterium]|nr:FAD-binding oxidoreductase [Acidimicrobiales bacterium]